MAIFVKSWLHKNSHLLQNIFNTRLQTYNSKLDFFFLEFFLNREDTKADNEISKPITSILHEEDALDYDEYDEEKSEGMLFL